MPPIFKTRNDSGLSVEIAGVGTLAARGRGGIPVEKAAAFVHELQDRNGKPLTGSALRKAAEAFAETHGLETKDLKVVDEEKLRVEAGGFPSGPSIEEVSRTQADRDLGRAQEHAEAPEAPPLRPQDVPLQETQVAPQPPGQET